MKKWDNLRILVVEDEANNLEFLTRLLQQNGANTIAVRTGTEAIEQIKNDSLIKIVLMDIKLPDIDGFETTRQIKALRPNIPVIAQTAYALYEDRELCIKNGCDDYISKPLKKTVLFELINKYINN